MDISLKEKFSSVNSKVSKISDILYRCGLILLISSKAMSLSASYILSVNAILLYLGIALLFINFIYKLIFILFKDTKKALFVVALVLFCFLYTAYSPQYTSLPILIIAIVGGLGVSADQILISGIIGNFIMIMNNLLISLTSEQLFQYRNFFYLGKNTFYLPRFNNLSLTDCSAHYFWIVAAYIWVRGKKTTWGEVAVLGFLNVLIYSFTGASTSFLCILLVLIAVIQMKLWGLVKSKFESNSNPSLVKRIASKLNSAFVFCVRYSFVIFSFLMILLSSLYDSGNMFFYKLDHVLHGRLSIGFRGIIDHGIHLLNSGISNYGIDSSADSFYNFLDCSYINIMVINGIIMLVFYLVVMTSIQVRQKKNYLGLVILAVCALSCVEEHHLSELPYNFFVLLMFSDFELDKKLNLQAKNIKTKSSNLIVKSIPIVISLVLVVSIVRINYPRFKLVSEIDRLDETASKIYVSIQDNLDNMTLDGSWDNSITNMSSYDYGDILDKPDDYYKVVGSYWDDQISDPKAHSYYSVYYDNLQEGSSNPLILDLLVNDEVKELVGNGSIVVEYDVVTGKVYSVWYRDGIGCSVISGGRNDSRSERLRTDIYALEGYSTGVT